MSLSSYVSAPDLQQFLIGVSPPPPRPSSVEKLTGNFTTIRISERELSQIYLSAALSKIITELVERTSSLKQIQRLTHAQWWLEKKIIPYCINSLTDPSSHPQGVWQTVHKSDVAARPDIQPPGNTYIRKRLEGPNIELLMHIGTIGSGNHKRAKDCLWVGEETSEEFVQLLPIRGKEDIFHTLITHELCILQILQRCQVPHIANISTCKFNDKTLFTMPTCRYDLHHYLIQLRECVEPPPQRIAIIRQALLSLCVALDVMHERAGVCHLDIKPENLLLFGAENQLLITDFSFARETNEQIKLRGTPGYIPPELFKSPNYTAQPHLDMWMVGVCLFFITHGYNPFSEIQSEQNIRLNFQQTCQDFFSELRSLRESLWKDRQDPVDPIIYKLLDADPSKRPSAKLLHKMLEMVYSIK